MTFIYTQRPRTWTPQWATEITFRKDGLVLLFVELVANVFAASGGSNNEITTRGWEVYAKSRWASEQRIPWWSYLYAQTHLILH